MAAATQTIRPKCSPASRTISEKLIEQTHYEIADILAPEKGKFVRFDSQGYPVYVKPRTSCAT